MDSVIPCIPDVNDDDVKAKFPIQVLTKIEGEPTYAGFFQLREELTQNAVAVESPFGGGQHGHWGCIADAGPYLAQAGTAWTVPQTGGVYPTFPPNSNDNEKKRIIKEFIFDEHGIKIAKAVERLLSNQVRQAIDEEFYMELEDPIFKFSKVTAKTLMTHILTNYAVVDDETIQQNRETFDKAPDLSQPIDVYFKKQERCKQILVDEGVEIHDADMVQKLQLHMGKTGLVSSEYTKWCAKPTADRTWTNGKKHFRKALREANKINKLTAAEAGLNANAVTQDSVREEAKRQISEQLAVSFDNMAMAATAKAETIDSLANTIKELTTSVAQLTKTNKDLVEQIKRLKSRRQNNNRKNNNNTSNKNAKDDIDNDGFNLNGYCWTCGYKIRRGHTRKSC